MKTYHEKNSFGGINTMAFIYDEENQCFSMETNHILFSCETYNPLFEDTANRLAEEYENRLPSIAEYIASNIELKKLYGELTKEEFLKMLEEMTIPWIFLKDNNCGTIAYCDEDYVIEFAFSGNFEQFYDLSIGS